MNGTIFIFISLRILQYFHMRCCVTLFSSVFTNNFQDLYEQYMLRDISYAQRAEQKALELVCSSGTCQSDKTKKRNENCIINVENNNCSVFGGVGGQPSSAFLCARCSLGSLTTSACCVSVSGFLFILTDFPRVILLIICHLCEICVLEKGFQS